MFDAHLSLGGSIVESNNFMLLLPIYGGVILLSIFALAGVKAKGSEGVP